jgi:hypothetical protein
MSERGSSIARYEKNMYKQKGMSTERCVRLIEQCYRLGSLRLDAADWRRCGVSKAFKPNPDISIILNTHCLASWIIQA